MTKKMTMMTTMNLKKLPDDIQLLIFNHLWGDLNTWKNKFMSCLEDINNYNISYYCKWCTKCGNKVTAYINPYTNDSLYNSDIICSSCKNITYLQSYPYNTWSGKSQGHFLLNNKTICLYASPCNSLERSILCTKLDYPYRLHNYKYSTPLIISNLKPGKVSLWADTSFYA